MSPNGRRAWRRTMRSRRKREVARLVFGPDTKARASLVSATRGFLVAYWRRHKDSMHVEGGLRLCCLVPNHQSPISITARSLVGMSMGARKRRWARDYDALPQSGRAAKTVSMLRAYGVYPKEGNPLAQKLRPCLGCCACWGADVSPADFEYDAECFGPRVTGGHTKRESRRMWQWQRNLVDDCDGSGVLPARRS